MEKKHHMEKKRNYMNDLERLIRYGKTPAYKKWLKEQKKK